MKVRLIIFTLFLTLLSGCGVSSPSASSKTDADSVIVVTDSTSQTVELQKPPQKVFSLSSSFTEIWLLAGGEISGVTNDALGERELGLPEDILVLGTIKDPNIETILSEDPDLVILSQDVASHISIAETLQKSDIPHYTAKVETLEDYLKVLGDFALITGDETSLRQNGEEVKKEVESLLEKLPDIDQESRKKALFLRALSTDVKVKARDHTVCYILEDIGVENIAAKDGFPLEELSIEAIIEADPDYIFVVAMGDENAAKEYLEQSIYSNPAWNSLSAVQNGNMIMLPKNLYHYKPNNKWGEAYETMLKIIFPEIYGED